MNHNTIPSLLVLLSALALSAACFKHPADKVDQMVCSSDNECPTGYRCITNPEQRGRCLKKDAMDGGQGSSAADAGTGGSGGVQATGGFAGGGETSTASSATGGTATGGMGGTTSRTETMGGAGAGGGTMAKAGTTTGGNMVPGGTTATHSTTAGGGTTSAAGNAGGTTATGGTLSTGGSTAARVCTAGDRMCKDGSTLLICDESGQWPSKGSACDFVCKENKCTGQCKPGDRSCGANQTLLTCADDGSWPFTGTACEFVCRDDACAGQCKPGQISCSGNSVRQCDPTGDWPTSYQPCNAGYTCDTTKDGCFCPHTLCEKDVCVDTTSDPLNCGACDYRCPGSCSAGACQCTTPSASNLMKDGGFDGDLSAWAYTARQDSTFIRSPLDATNCPKSGSLLYTFTSAVATGTVPIPGPCFPVNASLTYNMGAWIYLPKAVGSTGYATFGVYYFSDADCQTLNNVNNVIGTWTGTMNTAFDQWRNVRVENTKPLPGTQSARFSVEVGSNTAGGMGQAYFDNLYFTPTPGHF